MNHHDITLLKSDLVSRSDVKDHFGAKIDFIVWFKIGLLLANAKLWSDNLSSPRYYCCLDCAKY